MDIDEEMRTPAVQNDLIEYLDHTFSIDGLLHTSASWDASQRIGYLQGVRDVINHLKSLQN